jgi:hypothetical protein
MALKNLSPWPVLNPRPLGPVASTLTTTPPRRLCYIYERVIVRHMTFQVLTAANMKIVYWDIALCSLVEII